MKTVRVIVIALVAIVFSISSCASGSGKANVVANTTDTINVSGNCDMCKARIEKAALVDGVSKAEWSKETKLLTIVYDSAKVTNNSIQKNIAAVGHDTRMFKADEKAFNELPDCCKYKND